jgi:5'-3' exonuclease
VRARFGVAPRQIADFLALVGDSSDDIPGVPGVGPKTAAALLQHFDSVESLLADTASVAGLAVRGARGLCSKIEEYAEQIVLAKRLASLEEAVPLGVEPDGLRWNNTEPELAQALADEFGIGGLKSKIERVLMMQAAQPAEDA